MCWDPSSLYGSNSSQSITVGTDVYLKDVFCCLHGFYAIEYVGCPSMFKGDAGISTWVSARPGFTVSM